MRDVDAELGEDVGDVGAGGAGADEERLGDLAVGPALGQQPQHLPLARRQAERLAGSSAPAGDGGAATGDAAAQRLGDGLLEGSARPPPRPRRTPPRPSAARAGGDRPLVVGAVRGARARRRAASRRASAAPSSRAAAAGLGAAAASRPAPPAHRR